MSQISLCKLKSKSSLIPLLSNGYSLQLLIEKVVLNNLIASEGVGDSGMPFLFLGTMTFFGTGGHSQQSQQ